MRVLRAALPRLILGLVATWLLFSLASGCARTDAEVAVGSKRFTEGIVLGEVLVGLLADAGVQARHRRALGGTRIVYNALVSGEIDAYVEYSGTLLHETLADADLDSGSDFAGTQAALAARLAEDGIRLGGAIGFENNFALGMPKPRAAELGIERISDLLEQPDLRLRFGSEFMNRADGWPGLRDYYALPQRDVRGIEHELAYRALASGDADLTDVYTTDAEIAYYDLRTLDDDQGYFRRYDALLLYRADLEQRTPEAVMALKRSVGLIDAPRMIAMNAGVTNDGLSEADVASELLRTEFSIDRESQNQGFLARLLRNTWEHALLVGISLTAAVLVAVPLGIIAAHRRRLGQVVLATVGIAQTIPALALLVFMIPFFGIGAGPALVALFLYSLLPIVRNTHAGLTGISASLLESAEALGLPAGARLRHIELPLAMPTILAGIKTAAVINVGAATLGALIGAGGYGQPILTGIRLDDTALILEGAVPAALFALGASWLFERAERAVVPRGIRARQSNH
ncbi:MAG: glycine betaine ABC transporter substrate-binding protein [Thiohalocapsa sp.]